MKRFTANLPKIGIRPTIDGEGVRESPEDQTMAQNLKGFLAGNKR